jgi:hypothetical protein
LSSLLFGKGKSEAMPRHPRRATQNPRAWIFLGLVVGCGVIVLAVLMLIAGFGFGLVLLQPKLVTEEPAGVTGNPRIRQSQFAKYQPVWPPVRQTKESVVLMRSTSG